MPTQRHSLEHILATADAAVHVHSDLAAHRVDDGWQRVMEREGAPSSRRSVNNDDRVPPRC
jgi:hypothetical protein